MSAMSTHHDTVRSDSPAEAPASRTVINWTLAVLTLLGAAVVVGYAYMQVLGTAACTTDACATPGETTFGLITYGAPILAVLTIIVSFFTAKRPRGILVPLFTWAVLIVSFIVLMVTFGL